MFKTYAIDPAARRRAASSPELARAIERMDNTARADLRRGFPNANARLDELLAQGPFLEAIEQYARATPPVSFTEALQRAAEAHPDAFRCYCEAVGFSLDDGDDGESDAAQAAFVVKVDEHHAAARKNNPAASYGDSILAVTELEPDAARAYLHGRGGFR